LAHPAAGLILAGGPRRGEAVMRRVQVIVGTSVAALAAGSGA
jgi:hypothetical protein